MPIVDWTSHWKLLGAKVVGCDDSLDTAGKCLKLIGNLQDAPCMPRVWNLGCVLWAVGILNVDKCNGCQIENTVLQLAFFGPGTYLC